MSAVFVPNWEMWLVVTVYYSFHVNEQKQMMFLPERAVWVPVYQLVLILFFCGWKRLGLKNPGGGQTWTRTLKLEDSLPRTVTPRNSERNTARTAGLWSRVQAKRRTFDSLSKLTWHDYLEASAVAQAAVDSHGDRSNAWCRCLRRKRGAEPGLQGREPFSWDTSGSKHLLDEGCPVNQRRTTGRWKYLSRQTFRIYL